ncbi:uncharacterized protein C8orf76 homolog [Meleagris gallopavo]|uniref:uncharacterized protein C8orf76 homolog n=1 Tax=Meleagris gallopavo TaxID=9103 RepID=UPI0012ABCCCD|nr:uncharacterized protein C8orf76 homolog [Meleagris gallopavo]
MLCTGLFVLQWFCGETSGEEDAEVLTAQKFRADLAYREREFEKALCEYSNCLQHLPPSNIAMRRDVQEGQARCLSQLGRHKEALDIAERMRNSATNTDHLTTVLNLQFAIYRDLENVEKKIVCLQQLICLHPFNPWYWMSLAEAYMDLLRSLSPFCIPETNLHCSKEALLQLTQLQQSSFALENNIKCQKEIDDKVAQFGLNENSLLQMTKVMGADLIPEKLKEEFQGEVKCIGSSALSSLVTASASEFEIKWFDILRDDLCHLDRQFSSDIHIPPLAT